MDMKSCLYICTLCVLKRFMVQEKKDKQNGNCDMDEILRYECGEGEDLCIAGLNQMKREFRTREEVHARQPWGK